MPFCKHDGDSVKSNKRNLTKGCMELRKCTAENTRTLIPNWAGGITLDLVEFGSKICIVQNGAVRRVIRTSNIKYVA
jgi:hypothetical protein